MFSTRCDMPILYYRHIGNRARMVLGCGKNAWRTLYHSSILLLDNHILEFKLHFI